MASKKIFLITVLIAIYLPSFSQVNINDTITQKKQSANAEKLISENLKTNIFSASVGIDSYTIGEGTFIPRLAFSYNYLLPNNRSIGLEYQRWLTHYPTANAVTFDYRKYKLTRKNNLSSFGVDFGLSYIYDEGLFVNKYLMLSPNYLYGIRLDKALFLALKAKTDLMYSFEWNHFIFNPCISIGLLF